MIHVGSGQLRTLAELQKKVEVRTAAGGTALTWKRERDVWVRIKSLSSRLKVEARAREPNITHEVTARREDGDIDATKRLVVGTRAFMIAGIPDDVDERGRHLQFLAVEGVAT